MFPYSNNYGDSSENSSGETIESTESIESSDEESGDSLNDFIVEDEDVPQTHRSCGSNK